MEIKDERNEKENVSREILTIDVEKVEFKEIGNVLEKTPNGLFFDLVGRTWHDFVDKKLHRESREGEDALKKKKLEVLEDNFDIDSSVFEESEDLDEDIVDFLRSRGRILHSSETGKTLWYAPREIHESVLTSSHDGIISPKEKEALRKNAYVAVGGISVGASAIKALAKLGVGNMVGFDPKEIGVNHLGRIDTSPENLGRSKAKVIEEDIRFLNPYANWKMHEGPFDASVLERDYSLNVLVDAMDDPDEKLKMRQVALEEKGIVLMVTDLGNGRIILDVEDFRGSNTKVFGNSLDLKDDEAIEKWKEKGSVEKAVSIVGGKNLNRDMVDALPGIVDGEYASFPQLGLTSQIAGGVVANTVLNLVRDVDLKRRSIVDINKVNHKSFSYLSREVFGKYLSLLKSREILNK